MRSVSPEGHAWLVRGDAASQVVRVLDPFSPESETSQSIALGDLVALSAWSDVDAAALADGSLFQLIDMARIQLSTPTELAATTTMCGDPGTHGMLLTAGDLFERRADGQWWQWDAAVDGAGAPSRIVDFDGECLGSDNTTWLTAEDGTLWQLEETLVYRPIQFSSLQRTAVTRGMLAMLESDGLWIGTREEPDAPMEGAASWQPWVFDGAMATEMSASAGKLWLTAGSQLLRFDGQSFVEITHPLKAAATAVKAHAGGAWIASQTEVCHVATAAMLRVEGVRPYLRSTEAEHDLRVSVSDPDVTDIVVSFDGQPVVLSPGIEADELVANLSFDGFGWRDLVVSSDGLQRTVSIKRLPTTVRSWQSDIQPIYLANCTGSSCHGTSSELPALDTVEAWQSLAEVIRNRVVDSGTMPPPSAQGPDWGEDQVMVISEWLEGGMLP
jgi:hypothetical protein